MQNITDKAYNVATNRYIYHSAFWILLFLGLNLTDGKGLSLIALSNEFANLIFYGILVYLNLLYLIPSFLRTKNYFTYLGSLLLMVGIVTPIQSLASYFIFFAYEDIQYDILKNINWAFGQSFLIVSISTMLNIVTDWLRQNQQTQELERKNIESELQFLKTQVNPHFLFNTLNNLYALTLKKSEKAPEIVLKLSEMMRYMLYECNEKKVTLRKEINFLQNYLELEMLRQPQGIDVQLNVKGQIRNQEIAPLLFIAFIENSFKHGINANIEEGFVHIFLDIQDTDIQFSVVNSKQSQIPSISRKVKSGGIGLVNVKRRLEILYPNKYKLEIKESPKTYEIKLLMNLD